MIKTIKLPVYNMVITIEGESGFIHSDLLGGYDLFDDSEEAEVYNAGKNAIENMVLAHAIAGVNIESPEYLEGLETALDDVCNNS